MVESSSESTGLFNEEIQKSGSDWTTSPASFSQDKGALPAAECSDMVVEEEEGGQQRGVNGSNDIFAGGGGGGETAKVSCL